MNEWNWAKIIGNTLTVFATSAIAINIAGVPNELKIAFYAAGMTALLAFAKEMQVEGKEEEELCKPSISGLLLF